MDSPGLRHKSKVLALYTGGTIGMKTNDKGGLQKKNFISMSSKWSEDIP